MSRNKIIGIAIIACIGLIVLGYAYGAGP